MLALPSLPEDLVPTSARGWAEDTVEPWIREGTYVGQTSRTHYRRWMLTVPEHLAACGFDPPPTAPGAFTREHVEALKYRAASLRGPSAGRKLAPKTVAGLLCALRELLEFWARRRRSTPLLELVADRRLWRVRHPLPIRPARALESPEVLERLIASSDSRTRVGIVLGGFSGLRLGEICELQVRDLELSLSSSSWLVVRSGKGGKPRRAPVPPVARNVLLAATHGRAPADRVCGRDPADLRKGIAAAAVAAGLPHVHPHQLRATFIVFALRAGAPEQVVREWVGHESSETTHGYSRNDPLIESRARALVEAYIAGE